MMPDMSSLNAPKKIVDGLTEVFAGFARMCEGIAEQLERMTEGTDGAGMAEGEKMTAPVCIPVVVAGKTEGAAKAVKTHGKTSAKTRKEKTVKETVGAAKEKNEVPVPDEVSEAAGAEEESAEEGMQEVEPVPEETEAAPPPGESDAGVPVPADSEESERSTVPEEQSVAAITKDDITTVIVAKIKQNRSNNEKIGQLLKAYHVEQLSDLPASKYEAFLTDISQL